MDYLHRGQADLPASLWQTIDEAAVKAARDKLTARRFLDLQGPFGPGLTSIEVGNDDYCRQPAEGEAGAVMGRAISVPMLRKSFRLSIRRVAGLLTQEGRTHIDGGDWSAVERALADVLAAVTKLDEAGYRGPYALALAPALYNGLFRLYPGTDIMQLEHLRRLCTHGIYKAPIEGGVLVDPRLGALIVGQDLGAGYISQDGVHYHLFLSESLVLRIDEPSAICTIAARIRLDRGQGRARGEVVSGRRETTEELLPSGPREKGQRSWRCGERLLADQGQHHRTPVRRAPVLENEDALPRPQGEAPRFDRDRQLRRQESAADVSRHVVGPLLGVAITPDILGGQRAKEILEVAPHLGCGVFLDEQRCRGVAQKEREQPVAHPLPGYPAGDRLGDLVQALPGRRHFQRMLCHAHADPSPRHTRSLKLNSPARRVFPQSADRVTPSAGVSGAPGTRGAMRASISRRRRGSASPARRSPLRAAARPGPRHRRRKPRCSPP